MRSYPALEIRVLPDSNIAMDLAAAALDGFEAFAIDEPEPGVTRAFFGDAGNRDAARAAIAASWPAWKVLSSEISDEGWAEKSQAALKAVTVGRLIVAPPWDVPADAHGRDTVVILPSMGFGTGHHATTRLCLQALQDLDLRGKSVLDVGTGSGVLALAAARLGASDIVGIDNDPDAIANAIENRALNDLTSHVRFEVTGLEAWAHAQRYDVVTANLTGQVLIRFSAPLRDLVEPGGQLVVSGVLEAEEEPVHAALAWPVETRAIEEGWVCLRMRSQP